MPAFVFILNQRSGALAENLFRNSIHSGNSTNCVLCSSIANIDSNAKVSTNSASSSHWADSFTSFPQNEIVNYVTLRAEIPQTVGCVVTFDNSNLSLMGTLHLMQTYF